MRLASEPAERVGCLVPMNARPDPLATDLPTRPRHARGLIDGSDEVCLGMVSPQRCGVIARRVSEWLAATLEIQMGNLGKLLVSSEYAANP